MSYFDAWVRTDHARLFDAWSRVPTFVLQDRFERCNEIQMLRQVLVSRNGACTLLEVGCATGEFYRYLMSRYPKISYAGCDISEVALERARHKFGSDKRFLLTDPNLEAVEQLEPEIVFCRDVILHQPRPFEFLRKLYSIARHALVLRVRTRDVGATELDPDKSCQLNYGVWAPYMVLNCRELIEQLRKMKPQPRRVHLAKHYMVLGGHHSRYLPKDCYLTETGTAESGLLIEKGGEPGRINVLEENRPERLRLGLLYRAIAWTARHSPG